MRNIKFDKGFSLIEIFIVIAVIVIVAAIAFPSFSAYYKSYKFKDYAYSMENLIKASKLIAMEQSTNIGVCVDTTAKTISIVDMKTSRSKICTGTTVNTLRIEDDFVSLSTTTALNKPPGFAFDPRGFAIYTGNVCVSSGEKYYKVVVSSQFGAIRIDKGSGVCPK